MGLVRQERRKRGCGLPAADSIEAFFGGGGTVGEGVFAGGGGGTRTGDDDLRAGRGAAVWPTRSFVSGARTRGKDRLFDGGGGGG